MWTDINGMYIYIYLVIYKNVSAFDVAKAVLLWGRRVPQALA